MIVRRDTLSQALDELEAGTLARASTIAVSRGWWEALSANERDAYRSRAERIGIELSADEEITAHFVEVRGGEDAPPLSTEHHVQMEARAEAQIRNVQVIAHSCGVGRQAAQNTAEKP